MDEIYSLDILYADESIPEELYTLVRDGLCSQLDDRLHRLTNPNQYLTTVSWHNREQVSLLMVAALNGYDDIVRVLLTHCNSIDQVELKGQINISDEICIDGATALYCACYQGHFTVAKTLIELGKANLNQDTCDYPSYPLLINATIMNRLDIVRFLVENKYADVNETKSNDHDKCTALIWAAFRCYTSLVKYLIENGADVNYYSPGKQLIAPTPLTCATLRGQFDSFQLLYQAGADTNIKNNSGETLLMTAVKHKHYSIINFLLEQSINTIEDLELAACSVISKMSPSNEQINTVLELLKIALQRREVLNIPKVSTQSMDIYDYKQECQTIDELNAIKDDRERIIIETLLIRERMFSSQKDIKIIKPLQCYGDMLVIEKQFDKCFNVYIHIFDLHQKMDMGIYLCGFIWLFCKMLTANRKIPVDRFIQVCYLTLEPPQSIDIELKINHTLFLVIIATKILEQEGITKEEQGSIYRWIQDLCRYRLTTERGETLLHLCVDRQTNNNLNFRGSDTTSHIQFPNESGLRLLLSCGSRWLDLDAVESLYGNTPLHLICQESEDQNIIKLLWSFGCHMDCINKDGKIPLDYVKNRKVKALFMPKSTPKRLKCLCACIIANKGLTTDNLGSSTSTLNKFINLHGSLHILSECD